LATDETLDGLGPKTGRPRLNAFLDFKQANLTPVEGFILSRVDGRASFEEICRISSLPREQTLAILRKLRAAKLILAEGDSPAPDPGKTARPKVAAGARRGGDRHPEPLLVTNEMLREAQEKAEGPRKEEKGPGSLLERLDDGSPVAPADLIEAPDLPRETKERLVRLHRRIKQMDPYVLLGVTPASDASTIKRAFGAASKELHPDRYYGKNLGGFKEMLATIFSRVTEAMQIVEKARKARKP
jgi:DnaJ-domain-containing protein 1